MKYEAVVIGSGPGGAITAMYLAERGIQTLLLEEGSNRSTKPFSLEELIHKYRDRGQTMTLGNPIVQYVEGSCLGGGSEINSGLYHRLPDAIREQWEKKLIIHSFDAKALEPHYQACEKLLMIQKQTASITKASLKLCEAATRLNWKCVEVPRWYTCEGERNSMSRCMLPRFIESGGTVLTATKATQLRQQGKFWSILTSKGKIEAEYVFVCAGAIQTPFLLRRSGIKKNIGNSLGLHPTVKLTALFPEKVHDNPDIVPVHQIKEFSPAFSLGGSISRFPHLMTQLVDHEGFPHRFTNLSEQLFTYYAMISTSTNGKIRALPFCSSPLVLYDLSDADQKLLQTSQKKLAELLFASGAKRLFAAGGVECENLSNLPNQANGIMTIHLFGSCPMGENLQYCATDSFGKVHGFSNLYISDASLLGGAPSVNPQGIIMAIARRNIFHFLEQNNSIATNQNAER